MLDATKLGTVTAALMESLEDEDHPGAEMGEVLVMAEIVRTESSYIAWRCSDEREWVQRGLLHSALESERVLDEDAEE